MLQVQVTLDIWKIQFLAVGCKLKVAVQMLEMNVAFQVVPRSSQDAMIPEEEASTICVFETIGWTGAGAMSGGRTVSEGLSRSRVPNHCGVGESAIFAFGDQVKGHKKEVSASLHLDIGFRFRPI